MRALAMLLLAALLAGCGADPDAESDGSLPPSAADSGQPGGEGEGDGVGADAGSLASAAEAEAREQQGSHRIPPRDGLVLGADISYPNCPEGLGIPERKTLGLPMPKPEAEFVIIGLTNGPAYFVNPCLADQVKYAKQRNMMVAAYSVLSFPDDRQLREYGSEGPYDASTRAGRLRNAGHAQAVFNMASMDGAGLETPIVWVDIEPVKDWEWPADTAENVEIIKGAVQAYRKTGYQVGIYSVPSLWRPIAGSWGLGLPEWRSAGDTSQRRALTRCSDDPQYSIQGGPPIIAQWWDSQRDYNITCPGVARDLGRWFHQY